MITIPRSVRIFIGSTPIDMRKSIDGLMVIVQDELRQDAYSGHLFVVVSRRCDRVKILTWGKGGFVLVYKRLERGQFTSLGGLALPRGAGIGRALRSSRAFGRRRVAS